MKHTEDTIQVYEQRIEVMKAYLQGKPIQIRSMCNKSGDTWQDYNQEPRWDWSHLEYRVKKEKFYVVEIKSVVTTQKSYPYIIREPDIERIKKDRDFVRIVYEFEL